MDFKYIIIFLGFVVSSFGLIISIFNLIMKKNKFTATSKFTANTYTKRAGKYISGCNVDTPNNPLFFNGYNSSGDMSLEQCKAECNKYETCKSIDFVKDSQCALNLAESSTCKLEPVTNNDGYDNYKKV